MHAQKINTPQKSNMLNFIVESSTFNNTYLKSISGIRTLFLTGITIKHFLVYVIRFM